MGRSHIATTHGLTALMATTLFTMSCTSRGPADAVGGGEVNPPVVMDDRPTLAFPAGVVIEPSGYLTLLDAPAPPDSLFPTDAERSAARWGVSVEEAARRDALLRDLSRRKESWWNALLDREPELLAGSYMDWDAVDETGERGVEIVMIRSEFPEAALSYYVTHPNIRAVNADTERARLLDLRDVYVEELRERGVGVEVRERSRTEAASIRVDAADGNGLPTPPPDQRIVYLRAAEMVGLPPFTQEMSTYFRTDQRIPGGFGMVIQPANRGRLIARDGCLYIQHRGAEHLAVLPPWQTLSRDREGWPALLDADGYFEGRLGTVVTFSGGARPEAPPPGTPCPGATAMDLPGVGNDRPRPDWVDVQPEPPR